MARTKYKKKPEFWYCVQWQGTNVAEMLAFCPLCQYDEAQQKLIFDVHYTVDVGMWMLEDMAGMFSLMDDQRFKAFFSLDQGPP